MTQGVLAFTSPQIFDNPSLRDWASVSLVEIRLATGSNHAIRLARRLIAALSTIVHFGCDRFATTGQEIAGRSERIDTPPVESPGAQGTNLKSTQVLKFG